ncbi:MAG: hypothetical protein J6386_13200 [Candidatus Synoicihabitans palmerolidicus]|nr:hypothetical protein [Candidatus Synoicihabitans palmerolidicus]
MSRRFCPVEGRVSNGDDELYLIGSIDPVAAHAYRIYNYNIGRFYAGVKFFLWEGLLESESDAWRVGWWVTAYATLVVAASWFVGLWFDCRRVSMATAVVLWGGLAFSFSFSFSYYPYLSQSFLMVGWSMGWVMAALSRDPTPGGVAD